MSITDIFCSVDAGQSESAMQADKNCESHAEDRRSRVGAATDAAVVTVLDEVWTRHFGFGFHHHLKN